MSIQQLRQAAEQQAQAAAQQARNAVYSAVVSYAGGEAAEVNVDELLEQLKLAGLSLDTFEGAVAVQQQMNAIALPTTEELALLRVEAASQQGRFWAAVKAAKQAGVKEPVRASEFGSVVPTYAPLKAPHQAMRAAQRAVEQAERAAFKLAELEVKLGLLLGEKIPAPAPSKQQAAAFNADDHTKGGKLPDAPGSRKILVKDRATGLPVLVVHHPVRSDDGAQVHVSVRRR